MKQYIPVMAFAIICSNLFSQYPNCSYARWPEWSEIVELKEKVENSTVLPKDKREQLLKNFKQLKIVADDFYYCTNEFCKENKELDQQTQVHNNDAAALETDADRYRTAGCEGHDLSESQYASCVVWHDKLTEWSNRIDKRKKELDDWGAALDSRGYQLLKVEVTNNNNEFIKNARDALAAGFTGTKKYHVSAKSWINKNAIDGEYLLKYDVSGNSEPYSHVINVQVEDYKIAQAFLVEVEFENGKVISAKYLPGSLVTEAGYSYGYKGEVFLKEQKPPALGEISAKFTRTIAGHSKVLWLKEYWTGPTPDIWNTITIEVYADKVVTHGYASTFPTTYFWIGDEIFDREFQVQPSEFFR